jgi:hypothetical protein
MLPRLLKKRFLRSGRRKSPSFLVLKIISSDAADLAQAIWDATDAQLTEDGHRAPHDPTWVMATDFHYQFGQLQGFLTSVQARLLADGYTFTPKPDFATFTSVALGQQLSALNASIDGNTK